MGKTTVTFRLDQEKRDALDALAEGADRDRTYVLNEAIEAYLDAHAWQMAHIRKGLRQAKAGQFATEAEVARAMARWRK
jgi:predicted transcriptional regulator